MVATNKIVNASQAVVLQYEVRIWRSREYEALDEDEIRELMEAEEENGHAAGKKGKGGSGKNGQQPGASKDKCALF